MKIDPNACLTNICQLYAESQAYLGTSRGEDAGLELDHACNDLFTWLSRGGFEPRWETAPQAVLSYLQCRQMDFAKRQTRLEK